MVYEYQDTIITVQPGLGLNNWATCKLKKSGSWTTVKSPEMPRTDKINDAINNLHKWAEKKRLRRADCGYCYYRSGDKCTKYNKVLHTVEVVIFGQVHLRCDGCNEMERKCHVCGCTFNNPCEGGCYWVEEDLCSKCAEKENI